MVEMIIREKAELMVERSSGRRQSSVRAGECNTLTMNSVTALITSHSSRALSEQANAIGQHACKLQSRSKSGIEPHLLAQSRSKSGIEPHLLAQTRSKSGIEPHLLAQSKSSKTEEKKSSAPACVMSLALNLNSFTWMLLAFTSLRECAGVCLTVSYSPAIE
jgi:hypothetical protein